MIAIDINETQRDRNQVIAIAVELRSDVDTCLRAVAARKLDHLDTPVEVQRNKMARIARRVVMADNSIGLKHFPATILKIIPRRIPPVDTQLQDRPQPEHGH